MSVNKDILARIAAIKAAIGSKHNNAAGRDSGKANEVGGVQSAATGVSLQSRAMILGMKHAPYLSPYFQRCEIFIADNIPFPACIDKFGNVYLNPTMAKALDDKTLAALIIHEALHFIFDHASIAERLSANRPNTREREIFAIASDMVINHCIQHSHPPLELPRWKDYEPVTLEAYASNNSDVGIPESLKQKLKAAFNNGTDTVEVYQMFREECGKRKCGKGGGRSAEKHYGGSASDGVKREWETECNDNVGGSEAGPDEKASDGKGSGSKRDIGALKDKIAKDAKRSVPAIIRSSVASAVLNGGNSIGDSAPEVLVKWAKTYCGISDVDYVRELRQFLKSSLTGGRLATIQTYKLPNRRQYLYGRLLRPEDEEVSPIVAVVWDKSGSMSGDADEIAGREVTGVLKSLSCPTHLIVTRTRATKAVARTFRDVALLNEEPCGGTDMREGIALAETLSPKPSVIIVVTDGITPWPSEPPKAKLLVILVGRYALSAPVYAKSIKVEL